MVLMVPDDLEEITEPVDGEDSAGQAKAQLDDSEPAMPVGQKVDLDLDDAPFLEDEDEEEDEIEYEPSDEESLIIEEAPSSSKGLPPIFTNKFFLMGVIGALVLVIVFLLFFRGGDEDPSTKPPEESNATVANNTIPEEPKKPEEPPATMIRMQPFLIEQPDGKGNIRFLEVKLVLSTQDPGLVAQFKQETPTVRNAVYYFLKNKDLQSLSDKKSVEKLKTELLAVINQYMGFSQFSTIFFDKYLVR